MTKNMKLFVRSTKSVNRCELFCRMQPLSILAHLISIDLRGKFRRTKTVLVLMSKSLSLVLMSPKVGDSDYVYTRAKVLGFVKVSRFVVF